MGSCDPDLTYAKMRALLACCQQACPLVADQTDAHQGEGSVSGREREREGSGSVLAVCSFRRE